MLSRHWRPADAGLSPVPAPATSPASDPSASIAIAAPPETLSSNPIRRVAFYFGLAFLFTELTGLHELASFALGFNAYLLYLLVPPALFCGLLTGTLQRTFRRRGPWYWLAFYAWMILATPFSTWRGGSLQRVVDARVDLIVLVIVGGLATNWKEARAVFYTIAAGAVVNLLTARIFMKADEGRISVGLSGFDIENSNDLAAQLLLVLPFLLFLALGPRKNILIRIGVAAGLVYGIKIVLGTASRGALVGLAAMFLVLLLLGSMRQRIILLAAGGLIATVTLIFLPGQTLTRLATLFGQHDVEADESRASRMYLFQKSVQFTLQHPIFGVGPDQFSNYEGGTSVAAGKPGSWHATHCSWTQVSSECGIPALIFYVSGIGSAILLVVRVRRAALERGRMDIANACFCYLLGMAGFLVAITFLADAYHYYVPAMISLAVTMSVAAGEEPGVTG
jgi:O-antigen ligase